MTVSSLLSLLQNFQSLLSEVKSQDMLLLKGLHMQCHHSMCVTEPLRGLLTPRCDG